MSPLQRRQLLLSYLFATKGLPPIVFQWHQERLCQVQFTRHYLEYLSHGEPPHDKQDIIGVDLILSLWDREGASA